MAQLPLSLPQDQWQHICISWTLRDGVWKAYQGGKLKGRGEGLAAWHPIKPGGVLILGQEQVRGAEPPAEGWGKSALNTIRSSHMNRLEPNCVHPSHWLLSFVSKTPTLHNLYEITTLSRLAGVR